MIAVELEDGSEVWADTPPRRVALAAQRARAALQAGRRPRPLDLLILNRWLDEQERKHGGER